MFLLSLSSLGSCALSLSLPISSGNVLGRGWEAHFEARGAGGFEGAVNDGWRGADDVLPLLVLDEVEVLQGADDVIRLDGGDVTQLLDGHAALAHLQHLQCSASQS